MLKIEEREASNESSRPFIFQIRNPKSNQGWFNGGGMKLGAKPNAIGKVAAVGFVPSLTHVLIALTAVISCGPVKLQ